MTLSTTAFTGRTTAATATPGVDGVDSAAATASIEAFGRALAQAHTDTERASSRGGRDTDRAGDRVEPSEHAVRPRRASRRLGPAARAARPGRTEEMQATSTALTTVERRPDPPGQPDSPADHAVSGTRDTRDTRNTRSTQNTQNTQNTVPAKRSGVEADSAPTGQGRAGTATGAVPAEADSSDQVTTAVIPTVDPQATEVAVDPAADPAVDPELAAPPTQGSAAEPEAAADLMGATLVGATRAAADPAATDRVGPGPLEPDEALAESAVTTADTRPARHRTSAVATEPGRTTPVDRPVGQASAEPVAPGPAPGVAGPLTDGPARAGQEAIGQAAATASRSEGSAPAVSAPLLTAVPSSSSGGAADSSPGQRDSTGQGPSGSTVGEAGPTTVSTSTTGTPDAMPVVAGPTAAAPGSAEHTPAAARQLPTPHELAGQVARHLGAVRTLSDGSHHTVLRLSPEHLGDLTVTIDVQGANVQVSMAGQSAAIATLRGGLDELRRQLSEAGLDLGSIALQDNASDPGTTGGDARREGADPGPGADPGRRGPVAGSDQGAGPVARGSAVTGRAGEGHLDVRI